MIKLLKKIYHFFCTPRCGICGKADAKVCTFLAIYKTHAGCNEEVLTYHKSCLVRVKRYPEGYSTKAVSYAAQVLDALEQRAKALEREERNNKTSHQMNLDTLDRVPEKTIEEVKPHVSHQF